MLNKEYTIEDYEKQFTLKLDKYLEKNERILKLYKEILAPKEVIAELEQQKERILKYIDKYGKRISPLDLR